MQPFPDDSGILSVSSAYSVNDTLDSPDYLKRRHSLSDDLTERIAGVGGLIAEALK